MATSSYIQSVEVDQLWQGGRHVKLQFRPGVNVLSGMNGMGKSTVMAHLAEGLHRINLGEDLSQYGVKLTLLPEGTTSIKYHFVKNFDSPLMTASQLDNITDKEVRTYLDWKLYKLKANSSGQLIANSQWPAFCDLIDSLFSDTGKTIMREDDSLTFFQGDDIISCYKLSAGEKNVMIILLTVLLENQEPFVLLLDEPEICLHIDWQQHLLENILRLNPNVQIILSTHSPAIVMDGWLDTVTEITDSFI